MMAIRHGVRKRLVVCASLVLTAALAVLPGGCGNPGEGTVQVDPKVAARLGKFRGVASADYGKKRAELIRTKSRLRKDPSPK